MTAVDLVRVGTSVLFVGTFAVLAVEAVRSRRPASIDAAVLFGALTLVVLPREVALIFGRPLDPGVQRLSVVALLAFPFLLLRLVSRFVPVSRWLWIGVLAGFLAFSGATLSFGAGAFTGLLLPVILYLALPVLYAAAIFVRQSRRRGGVTRNRCLAAAWGSGMFALALLSLLVAPLLGSAYPAAAPTLLAFGSAVAYAVSFSPPGLLRRAWYEAGLRRVVERLSAASARNEVERITEEIEAATQEAFGGLDVVVAHWDDERGTLRSRTFDLGPMEGVTGRAFREQRALISDDPSRDHPDRRDRYRAMNIGSLMAAPLSVGDRRLGTITVYEERTEVFTSDDLDMLAVIAGSASLALENARRAGELRQMNGALEARVAELSLLNDQYDRATRAKSEFLANMSHELRTPLNGILGFTEILLEQVRDRLDAEQVRYLENVRVSGEHLLGLINDILDLSKVEARRLDVRLDQVGLHELLGPVIASARTLSQDGGITLEIPELPQLSVQVDPGRIRQVLYNLLSNAVKFTPAGGRVSFQVHAEGSDLFVSVTDSGIGIAAADQGRVFGVFERLHEGRYEAEGTGLGLALSRQLVELHGGSIGFESREGQGSTFWIRLPGAVVRPTSGPRLLVIEDAIQDAQLITAVAREEGLACEVASTGARGLAAARREAPVGVVLDLRLPDMRGEEVMEVLQKDAATRGVPVMVVTVEDEIPGHTAQMGAAGHITKPIARARLRAWVRSLLVR